MKSADIFSDMRLCGGNGGKQGFYVMPEAYVSLSAKYVLAKVWKVECRST